MCSKFERMLAWRYMRSKRREGFVSVITLFSTLGIMLGVATLILVTSLMNGIRSEMLSNFLGIDGEVTLYSYQKNIPNYPEVLEKITPLQGVAYAVPRIEGQVMVTATAANAAQGKRALGAQVMGVRAEDMHYRARIYNAIAKEALAQFTTGGGVVVGQRLAENLGLEVGQSITLISPEGRQTFAGMVPRIKAYPIVGTFSLGMHEMDSSLVLMPYADAARYFGVSSGDAPIVLTASAIEVSGHAPEKAEALAERIAKATGGNLRVYDWQHSHASVFAALSVQRNVMIVILTLIIIVAAFNIISGLIMLVQDKGKEIAILRTMGATRMMILRIFLMSGMAIGVVGTGLGLGLGLLAAENLESLRKWLEQALGVSLLPENIYFLSTLPTRTDPTEVVSVVGLSLALSFFATLYPAWRASSQQPADALRYE